MEQAQGARLTPPRPSSRLATPEVRRSSHGSEADSAGWRLEVPSCLSSITRSTTLDATTMAELRKLQEAMRSLNEMRESQASQARARRVLEDLAWAFDALALERHAIRVFLKKKVAARIARTLRGRFERWLSNTRRKISDSEAARRSVIAFYLASTRRGLNSWMVLADEERERKRALHIAFQRWRQQNLFATLARLSDVVYAARMMRRGAVAFIHQALMRGIVGWKVAYADAVARKRVAQKALLTMSPSGRATHKALNSWLALREARMRIRVALAGFSPESRATRKMFIMWRSFRGQGAMMKVAIRRALNAEHARALGSWTAYVVERKARARALRKATGRWQNRGAASAFSKLGEMASQLRRIRQSAMSFQQRHLVRSWCAWVGETRQLSAARLRRRRALQAMAPDGRAQLRAFNSWLVWLQQRLALRTSASRFHRPRLGRSWSAWFVYARDRKAMRARKVAAARSIRPAARAQRKAFNTWHYKGRNLSKIRGSALSLSQTAQRRAVNGWLKHHLGRLDVTQRIEAAVRSMKPETRAPRRAFNSWQYERLTLSKIRSSALSILQTTQRRALNAWLKYHLGQLEAKQQIGAGLRSMKPETRAQRKAFNSWQFERLILSKIRSSALGILQIAQRRALNGWLKYHLGQFEAKQQIGAALRSMKPETRAQRRVFNTWQGERLTLSKLRHSGLAISQKAQRHALNGWLWYHREDAQAKRRIEMACRSMRPETRAQRRVFVAWAVWRHGQVNMRNAALGIMRRGQRRGLNSWLAWHTNRVELQRRRAVVMSTLGPQGRAKRRAYNSWRNSYQQTVKIRTKAAAMLRKELRRSLNSWRDWCDTRTSDSESISRAIRRWRRREVLVTMAYLSLRAHHWRGLRRAARRFIYRERSRAWASWREWSRARSSGRAKARAAFRQLQPDGRAKRRTINSWREMVCARSSMMRSALAMRMARKRRALNGWVGAWRVRCEARDEVNRALASWGMSSRQRALARLRILWPRWRRQARWRHPERRVFLLAFHRLAHAWGVWCYWNRVGIVVGSRKERVRAAKAIATSLEVALAQEKAEVARLRHALQESGAGNALSGELALSVKEAREEVKQLEEMRQEHVRLQSEVAALHREREMAVQTAQRAREMAAQTRLQEADGSPFSMPRLSPTSGGKHHGALMEENAKLRAEAQSARSDVQAAQVQAARAREELALREKEARTTVHHLDEELRRAQAEALKARQNAAEARAKVDTQAAELVNMYKEMEYLKEHIAWLARQTHTKATVASRGWRVPESPDWLYTPTVSPPRSPRETTKRENSPLRARHALAAPRSRISPPRPRTIAARETAMKTPDHQHYLIDVQPRFRLASRSATPRRRARPASPKPAWVPAGSTTSDVPPLTLSSQISI